ncbi:unnamed protein product [Choristocarpus tenellus]
MARYHVIANDSAMGGSQQSKADQPKAKFSPYLPDNRAGGEGTLGVRVRTGMRNVLGTGTENETRTRTGLGTGTESESGATTVSGGGSGTRIGSGVEVGSGTDFGGVVNEEVGVGAEAEMDSKEKPQYPPKGLRAPRYGRYMPEPLPSATTHHPKSEPGQVEVQDIPLLQKRQTASQPPSSPTSPMPKTARPSTYYNTPAPTPISPAPASSPYTYPGGYVSGTVPSSSPTAGTSGLPQPPAQQGAPTVQGSSVSEGGVGGPAQANSFPQSADKADFYRNYRPPDLAGRGSTTGTTGTQSKRLSLGDRGAEGGVADLSQRLGGRVVDDYKNREREEFFVSKGINSDVDSFDWGALRKSTNVVEDLQKAAVRNFWEQKQQEQARLVQQTSREDTSGKVDTSTSPPPSRSGLMLGEGREEKRGADEEGDEGGWNIGGKDKKRSR